MYSPVQMDWNSAGSQKENQSTIQIMDAIVQIMHASIDSTAPPFRIKMDVATDMGPMPLAMTRSTPNSLHVTVNQMTEMVRSPSEVREACSSVLRENGVFYITGISNVMTYLKNAGGRWYAKTPQRSVDRRKMRMMKRSCVVQGAKTFTVQDIMITLQRCHDQATNILNNFDPPASSCYAVVDPV